MRVFERLTGLQNVGRVTIKSREDGDHLVTVAPNNPTSAGLDAVVLDAALFLHYTAKALHALGSGQAADELRRHIALSGVALRMVESEPFASAIDRSGQCVGLVAPDPDDPDEPSP